MNTKQKVDKLWEQMRDSINAAYAAGDADKTHAGWDEKTCLRDYAENISWSDSTARLLGRESANERQHRTGRPSVSGFSVETAAKLILMRNVADGSRLSAMPPATNFLILRQTAVEAEIIGYLIREFVSDEWRQAVDSLDYTKLMTSEFERKQNDIADKATNRVLEGKA